MNSAAAAEHLQAIRTLMERSALYRRALAPIMALAGSVGTAAGVAGCLWFADASVRNPAVFVGYWLGVSLVPFVGSLVLARRQALSEGEPFWSAPTRRVVTAAAPAWLVGLVLGLVVLENLLWPGASSPELWRVAALSDLPLLWVMLYGCALHAAGGFMPRGIRWFGAGLVMGACVLFAASHVWEGMRSVATGEGLRAYWGHGVMGVFFGLLHLAYAAYLSITERKRAVL